MSQGWREDFEKAFPLAIEQDEHLCPQDILVFIEKLLAEKDAELNTANAELMHTGVQCDQLKERITRLEEALKYHGQHKPQPGQHCSHDAVGNIIQCECGLQDALQPRQEKS